VLLAVGSIPNPERLEVGQPGDDFWITATEDFDGILAWTGFQAWCRCPKCGAYDVTLEGRAARMYCGHGAAGRTETAADVLSAYRAARSARFEHGQSGATL
jgi:hypothetical protein